MKKIFKINIMLIGVLLSGLLLTQTALADTTYTVTDAKELYNTLITCSGDTTIDIAGSKYIPAIIDCSDIPANRILIGLAPSLPTDTITINGNGNTFTNGSIYIMDYKGTITLNNIVFDNCQPNLSGETAGSDEGGAITVLDSSNLTINNCTFKDCKVNATGKKGEPLEVYGGAIFFSASGNLSLSGCQFTNCEVNAAGVDETANVDAKGGAIYMETSGDLTIDQNCAFNTCNATVSGAFQTADVYGGAIYINNNGDFLIDNCSFTDCQLLNKTGNNENIDAEGGAIALIAAQRFERENITIIDCTEPAIAEPDNLPNI